MPKFAATEVTATCTVSSCFWIRLALPLVLSSAMTLSGFWASKSAIGETAGLAGAGLAGALLGAAGAGLGAAAFGLAAAPMTATAAMTAAMASGRVFQDIALG